jgi:hypothetical protein
MTRKPNTYHSRAVNFNPAPDPDITNKKGIARVLQTSTRTIDRKRKAGEIPWFKCGGIKFRISQVLASVK